jgi:hypothetical protein
MKSCTICLKPFVEYSTTQRVCSTKCAVKLSKSKNKLLKHSDVYTPEIKSELQNVINSIARLIDQKVNCIQCRENRDSYDAGHYHSVGNAPHIRYDLFNIYKQCVYDNHKSEGNKTAYLEGIEFLYGTEHALKVKNMVFRATEKRTNHELYIALRKARKFLRWLRTEDMPQSPHARLQLRQKGNDEIWS